MSNFSPDFLSHTLYSEIIKEIEQYVSNDPLPSDSQMKSDTCEREISEQECHNAISK